MELAAKGKKHPKWSRFRLPVDAYSLEMVLGVKLPLLIGAYTTSPWILDGTKENLYK